MFVVDDSSDEEVGESSTKRARMLGPELLREAMDLLEVKSTSRRDAGRHVAMVRRWVKRLEGPLFDEVGPATTLSYGKRMFVIAASETASPDLRAQCYLAAFLVFCNMVPDVLAAYRACVDLSNVPPPAGCVLYESTVLDCLSVLVQRGPLPHELEFIPHLVTPEFARLLGRLVVDSPLAAVYFVKAPTTGLAKRPTALHARHCLRLHVLPALLFGPAWKSTTAPCSSYPVSTSSMSTVLPPGWGLARISAVPAKPPSWPPCTPWSAETSHTSTALLPPPNPSQPCFSVLKP